MKTTAAFSRINENPIDVTVFTLFLFNCICYSKMTILVKESKCKNVSINFTSLYNPKARFNMVGNAFRNIIKQMSGIAANYNLAYDPVLTPQKRLNITGTFSKQKRDPDYPDYFEEVTNFFLEY